MAINIEEAELSIISRRRPKRFGTCITSYLRRHIGCVHVRAMCAHLLVVAGGVAEYVDGVGHHRLSPILAVLVAQPVPAHMAHHLT